VNIPKLRLRPAEPARRGAGPNISTDDFAALLGGLEGGIRRFHTGEEVTGYVVRVEPEIAYLDLGGKSEGMLALTPEGARGAAGEGKAGEEGPKRPAVGDRVTAYVVAIHGEQVRLAYKIGRSKDNIDQLVQAHEGDIPVTGRVVAVNKGGYEIDLGGARGFCPHSQMDLHFVEKPEIWLERELEFRISEIREGGRNIVLSRRALLEEEEAKKREQTLVHLREGAILPGKITNLRPFGAFVDLGGIEGLVHVSELSHERVEDPAQLVQLGQEVQVQVLAIEDGGRRISLSMKSLLADPWTDVEERFPVGTRLPGKVVRLQPFGAFVQLAPGVDGLIHVSALSPGRRISHPKDVVKEGQTLEVVITAVDEARQRISLALADSSPLTAAGGGPTLEVGAQLTGIVDRVEKFGVFVKLAPGVTGLIPRSELDVPADREPRNLFPKGSEVQVKLIEVDEARNRYTLSRRSLREDEERSSMQGFLASSGSGGGEGAGMGTLGDLLRAKLQQRKG